jgi:2-polyprenyl-3-methyl-5-hydroxy-6-metoxy-1,4-benzoquinol methylase
VALSPYRIEKLWKTNFCPGKPEMEELLNTNYKSNSINQTQGIHKNVHENSVYKLIEFDAAFYTESYTDLNSLNPDQLKEHYFNIGYEEGRIAHPNSSRENFINQINGDEILEIGPFCNPTLKSKNVKYFDVLSTEDLKKRALLHDLDPSNIKNIDYVSKHGDLNVIDQKFDVVFSSHNLEHHPDLINHLNQVSERLKDNGSYAMIVPNAKYCFDADLPLSKISDIIDAHFDKRKYHTLGSVIEHRALTTHNNPAQHWSSQGEKKYYKPLDLNRIELALREYNEANGAYIDVHAWQFDPKSLSDILNTLIKLKFVNFKKVYCFGPIYGSNEFNLLLIK